jgi:hypothetical protein
VDGAERIRALLNWVPFGEVERWHPAVRC